MRYTVIERVPVREGRQSYYLVRDERGADVAIGHDRTDAEAAAALLSLGGDPWSVAQLLAYPAPVEPLLCGEPDDGGAP